MARFSSIRSRTFGGRNPYILFLCTGNTCRSPTAYGIVKKFFEEEGITDLEVRTAGVMTIPGLLPTQECRQILFKEGIDISLHRSCKLTPDLLKRANLILGMTSFHVQMALRMSKEARGKTFLLKEYVGLDVKNSQIQDPMGCTLEVYKKVYREIRRACRRLVKMDLMTPGPPAAQAKRRAAAARRAAKPDQRAKEKKAAKAKKALAARKGAEAKKTTAKKKIAPKKAATKKKTTVKKAPAKKKITPKKAAAKKKITAKKAAGKKKTTAKKATARKRTTARKVTAKKAAPRKTTSRKKSASAKKPASRKSAARREKKKK